MKETEKSIKQNLFSKKETRRELVIGFVNHCVIAFLAGDVMFNKIFFSEKFKPPINLPFYKSFESVKVNEKKVVLTGIAHEPKTFIAYEKEIRKKIANSPLVIIENFVDKVQELALPSIEKEKLYQAKTAPGVFFYSQTGKICAEENKDIVVVDPETVPLELMHYLLLGLPVSLANSDLNNLISKLQNKPFKRRNFLRGIGYMMGGTSIASNTDLTRNIRGGLENFEVSYTDGKADKFGWDSLVDYRDVRSAEGVSRSVKMYEKEIGEKEVPFFIGAAHRGVIEYLKDEKLRKTKEIFYNPQKIISENTIRRYHFNREENKWELKEKQVF